MGFRYTVESIAARLAVSGYVRNLTDGRVELVAEGDPNVLDGLVSAIEAAMAGHISTVDIQETNATGEFKGFSIKR